MPIVQTRIKRPWLLDASEIQFPRRYQHKFTDFLLGALPEMVAQTLNEVDGTALRAGEVVVYPQPVHPLARNASTFMFDLQCGHGGKKTLEEQEARRAQISDVLGEKIADFIVAHPWANGDMELSPDEFDVEVRPIGSSGHTYANHVGGEPMSRPMITHSWGHPQPEASG